MPTETSLSSLSQIIDGEEYFRELDDEMSTGHLADILESPFNADSTDKTTTDGRGHGTSLLRRIYEGLRRGSASPRFNRRHSVTSFSYSNIFPSPSDRNSADSQKSTITCRLCEGEIPLEMLGEHTRWCKDVQNCSLKKTTYDAFLRRIVEDLHMYPFPDRITQNMVSIAAKVLSIDEVDGLSAASSLAKVAWKLTKILLPPTTQEIPRKHLKRLKYIVLDHIVILLISLTSFCDRWIRKRRLLRDSPSCCPRMLTSVTFLQRPTPVSIPRPVPTFTKSHVLFLGRNGSATPIGTLSSLFTGLWQQSPRQHASKSALFSSTPPRASVLRACYQQHLPQISDFEIIKPISRGAYGAVYLARKRTTHDLYAIKAIPKSRLQGNLPMMHQVLTEKRLLSQANSHDHIVNLYYAFQSANHLFLVMEYLIGGDLSSILMEQGTLSEEVAAFYTAELVLALEFLHSHHIIHRDVKPDNLLLDANGHLKLSDFGISGDDYTTGFSENKGDGVSDSELGKPRLMGTPDYLAPEVIRRQGSGVSVDWWSLGICLYEFIVGIPPFNAGSPEEIFEKILNHQTIDWESMEMSISDDARNLITRLLDPNPATRITGTELKSHPFFSHLKWESLGDQPGPLCPHPTDPLDTSRFEARNSRYPPIALPEDLFDAERIDVCSPSSATLFPSQSNSYSAYRPSPHHYYHGTQSEDDLLSRTSSPFDVFAYKNVSLLGEINRDLSVTPSPKLRKQQSSGTTPKILSKMSNTSNSSDF